MQAENTEGILAIITLFDKKEKVAGGAPIFYADNKQEMEEISMLLARLTLGMVHDLGNGINIIIKH
ncbi:MAG: capping complex subunit for YIEGIA [Halanaerobiales bacterium]